MKDKKNSEKEKKALPKEGSEVKKPFNLKDTLTTLKNNDNFIIILEIVIILALVVAIVLIISGQNKNNGGGNSGGSSGGITDDSDDSDDSSGNTSAKIVCPECGERIRKVWDEFHHIIDRETLMPADRGYLSVSVICEDSGMGDGLSTALFCMDLEEALAFVNSLDGVEAMFVTEDEVKHYSDGFQNYTYTPSGNQSGSNSQKQSYKAYNFNYFDTISTIIGYEASESNFKTVSDEALNLLGEYHKLFDIYNEYDGMVNLYNLNQVIDGQHPKLKVDRKIIDMLLYAKEMYTLTDGRMNVAMGSVLSLWHDYRDAGSLQPVQAELPPMDKLQEASKHTDINSIVIDEENSTVWISDPYTKLDVGAIAKGYAVEMVAEMLEAKGKTDYTLNIGGNVRTIGTKANGDKWVTGIENPNDTSVYIEYIQLAGETIVTSGSYQRYYKVIVGAKCSKCSWIYDQDLGIPSQNVAPGTLPKDLKY